MAAGLTVSFTVIGVLVTAFGHLVGLDLDSINRIAAVLMMVFGIGVSSVLLALAYGSRELLQARRARLMALMPLAKPIMGVTLVLVGIALYFHLFGAAETWLLDVMPAWLLDLSVRY